ncbi:MAG: protein kinase [Christensenellaceae bacterium]|nr:protein kinase [Christensenellaceae bacterium]
MIGNLIDGRYRVESMIGSGGMANVYKACDTAEDRVVAIKMLKDENLGDAEFVRRFAREAQAVLSLSHPNIVESYDVGTDPATGALYIVLEYVEGGTLKELIQKKGALPPKTAVHIACQVLDALQHAHEQGFIHRDVKPQNVMLTAHGKAKLADFGIARDAGATTRTFAGTGVIGSVHYISPEQARGDTATAESDIYSCSILLYEMLTGEVPFAGDNSVVIALKHLQEDILPPNALNPRLPRALSDVVVKGADKDPALRYKTAELMHSDLQRALREPRGKFARLNMQRSGKRKGRRTLGIVNIAVMLLLILGSFISVFLIIRSSYEAQDEAGTEFIVPTLVGKTLRDAQDLSKLRGFALVVGDYEISEDQPEGQVLRQAPAEGIKGKEGDTISVIISSGSGYVVVPQLVALPLQDALLLLAEENLQVGSVQHIPSDLPDGQVMRQDPEADTRIFDNETITLFVSGTETSNIEMPSFTGLTTSVASAVARDSGFARVWIYCVAPVGDAPEERVQKQLPMVGLNVNKSTPVELWISRTYLGDCAADIAANIDIEGGKKTITTTALLPEGTELVLDTRTMEAGKQQTISFTGYLRTAGQYECVVYADGVQLKRITAEFKKR